jgi:AMP phosphorylase
MNLKYAAKCIDLTTAGIAVAVMHKDDAEDLDVKALDRVEVSKEGRNVTCVVDTTTTFVGPGTVGLFREAYTRIDAHDGEELQIRVKEKPDSVRFIKQKLAGNIHPEGEIRGIIDDLMNDRLTDVELTAWITAVYIRGLDKDETVALTKAIIDSGETLNLRAKRVYDKHCSGGVVGNRTTLLLVPVVAAAGLAIPKTSSRAITSPAGSADTMEVLAPVSLSKDEIETIVNKTGGCIVWGGAVNLAAADDKLIRVRHPLALDPRGMLLASIMAKKKAVGATDVIIDIPIGEGAKLSNRQDGEILAKQFNAIGKALDMNIHSLLTNGDHPIGSAIGPALEARETLRILSGEKVSIELKDKASQLSGVLLELAGVAEQGKGPAAAMRLIDSGKADKKFREIVEAQGGDPEVKPDDVKVGDKTYTVKSDAAGRIEHIDNRGISSVVRAAGAPGDKAAGMYLHVEDGDKVSIGQPLFTIYATSERKIDQALDVYKTARPFRFSKIVLEELA